jgi:hypothetical protein
METKNFINSVSIGNALEAKDALTDMLSTRAFEALNARKIDIAQTLFNNDVVEEEVELTQEEYDQLDELSKATVRGYLKGSKSEAESQLRGDVSDKAASLGRTQQDKDDSRYEGKKRAIAKLGGSNSVSASKVPAK